MQIELLLKWESQTFSGQRANEKPKKFFRDFFCKRDSLWEDPAVNPTPFEEVLANSERSIILPYGLSVVDGSNIYNALCSISGSADMEVITKGPHGREVGVLASGIEIYNFQFHIAYGGAGITTTSIEHRSSGSFVYWDYDEEYCFIAGSKLFCELAFPHSQDLLQQYYIDSMVNGLFDKKYWLNRYQKLRKITKHS